MTKPFLLAVVLLIASAAAFADTTFYNQPWNGGDFLCDANTPTCTAVNVTGWTVYDNFIVPNGVTRITDFTYVDNSFAWIFYTSTNWTVFGPSVQNPFGVMPRYSGTAVATMTDLGGGYMMFSITGLNLAVTPGTWIVGFQNNMGGLESDIFSTRGTSNVGDGVVWQQANGGIKQFTWSDNTAFSVSTSSVPEPSTLLMLGTGLLGGIGVLRRKLSRFVLPCMTATLVLLAAGIAHANSTFIETFTQVGPNVVVTGSGTIDLTGLASFGSTNFSPELYPFHGITSIGAGFNVDFYFAQGTTGFSFGPGDVTFPSSLSGDTVSLEDFALDIEVPQGYVSGAPLSGSATYDNATLASLGVTPGTYTVTWSSGVFVLEIPASPTPEPGSFLLLGSGVLVFAQVLRRKLL